TRVGLEDGNTLADGTVAKDNAAIIAAAVAIFRG
ncbi:MAG: 3-keto-5-aminohexanoate cleavage protein, partial [Mesorhizobium sp.]